MTDTEILEAMRQMMEPVNLKLANLDNRLSNLDNRMSNLDNRITNLEYEVRKGFRDTRQDIETIVEVLEAKGILPKAL